MLGKIWLKNRLLRSATWGGLADVQGHMPEKLYEIYEALAAGGVGAIITGFTSVSEDDRCFGGMARLSHDDLIMEHRRLTDLCHSWDCPVIAQIALGEYAGGKDVDGMTEKDICLLATRFADAAQRAEKAGYDGVQIHAAHGFFLSRFLSPACNHRKDVYGGGPEYRARIITDIMTGIRQKAPSLHIGMKINCSDFIPGGLTPRESAAICRLCANEGLDSIEVSGNGTSVPGIRPGVNEAYFGAFALALAEQTDIPVILVGGHRSMENMENVLNSGKIAFLSLSRPLIREPDLPLRWMRGDKSPARCISCNMCYRTEGHRCCFSTGGKAGDSPH